MRRGRRRVYAFTMLVCGRVAEMAPSGTPPPGLIPNRSAPFFASQCGKAGFTRIFTELSRSTAIFFSSLCSTRGIAIVVSRTIRSSALIRAAPVRSTASSASRAVVERSPQWRIRVRNASLTPSFRPMASLTVCSSLGQPSRPRDSNPVDLGGGGAESGIWKSSRSPGGERHRSTRGVTRGLRRLHRILPRYVRSNGSWRGNSLYGNLEHVEDACGGYSRYGADDRIRRIIPFGDAAEGRNRLCG